MTIGASFDSVLTAAQADQGWAYERLYRDLSPAVHGWLRLQGAREPEDLASEVFLGTFRALGRFRGDETAFRSWVFTIAYRRLADERRRSHPDAESPSPEALGGDVESEALSRLGTDNVVRLCRSVSPAQRDVLLLRLVAGLTLEQVGDVLGKSLGAVKVLQCRALSELRSDLARCVTL